MTFLFGDKLCYEIRKILREPDVRIAVAFWGNGSEQWVTAKSAKIVCNLKMGGTNPCEMKRIAEREGVEVKQSDRLHAKVYIGGGKAIVTSANASANGLGLEDDEQAGWDEAGILIDESAAVTEWFDRQWLSAKKIEPSDWRDAKRKWKQRRTFRPTRLSFAEFDVNDGAKDLPLISSSIDQEWSVNHDALKKKCIDEDIAYFRVSNGFEVEHDDDIGIMKDRWILVWMPKRGGMPRKTGLRWVRTSAEFVRDGFRYDDSPEIPRNVMLAPSPNDRPPVPFDLGDESFVRSFLKLMSENDYSKLRDGVKGEAWFSSREGLILKFWQELQIQYRQG